MAMATAMFEEMEKAACCLLQIIKDTPELGKATKVAIAGSMAMQKHLPKYTQDGAAVSASNGKGKKKKSLGWVTGLKSQRD